MVARYLLLGAILTVLLITSVAARVPKKSDRFYEFGSNVFKINDEKQFKREVMESNYLWAVEFYREGCGYCQLLTPIWEKVAEHLKNLVRVAAVDTERSGSLAANHADPSNPIQEILTPTKNIEYPIIFTKSCFTGCANNKDLYPCPRAKRQDQGCRLQWGAKSEAHHRLPHAGFHILDELDREARLNLDT
jgi:thiol-disulfide isomerase/thioredoxin